MDTRTKNWLLSLFPSVLENEEEEGKKNKKKAFACSEWEKKASKRGKEKRERAGK